MGIISAKGRSTTVGDGSYEDFLQTDAPINHGNSGGALVNTKGELVGINSQILSSNDGNIGIGFAIPSNMAKNVMDQLRTKGKVTRAQLGVTVQQVTSDLAESLGLKQAGGAIVSSVSAGSAADKAGIKRGDVIESFNGQPVHDFNSLRNRVADAGPGSTADVVVTRDGSEKHLSVKLDEATASEGDPRARQRAQRERRQDVARRVRGAADAGAGRARARVEGRTRAGGGGRQPERPRRRRGDPGGRRHPGSESPAGQVGRRPEGGVEEERASRPTLLLIQRNGSDIFVTVKPANG